MSSHREAPEISKDPVADSTDLYAFVSPDKPDTVTIIANYIPLEAPAGGPNFYEFGDDVMYNIYIDNDADGEAEIQYQFRFHTRVHNKDTFLYNTGPISSNEDSNWNRQQRFSVFKMSDGKWKRLGQRLTCPPCNIGPRSTPHYAKLAHSAVHKLPSGETVFAGQRREGFYVDLGSVFDLAALRPFQKYHLLAPNTNTPGVDTLSMSNVHSIALQIPKRMLTPDGSDPTSTTSQKSVIGVWTGADRRKALIREAYGAKTHAGPFVQVSRLGNPLINEVVIPMTEKDGWNTTAPKDDSQFLKYYAHPVLQDYLVALYPGVFPNLANYTKERADLEYILLHGIPAGVVSPTFQNYTGSVAADMLRLNMAVPPTTSNPSPYGVLGGDLAGFPNGRRVFDDTVTIELRAVAGATIPLVDKSYTADSAATAIYDVTPPDMTRYQPHFPYLGIPLAGFDVPAAA